MDRTLRGYSVWLDFMRGCAALLVFLGHARVLFLESIVQKVGLVAPSLGTAPAAALPTAGAMNTNFSHEAVIVFFVLSGYLVGGSVIRLMRNGNWDIRTYTIQRMSRLWTVLIPALMLTAAIDSICISYFGTAGIYGAPTGQEIVFKNLEERSSLGNFFCNVFFLQGLILGDPFGTDSPLWTLAYEFWFYAAFPVVAIALDRHTSLVRRVTLMAAFVCTLVLLGRQFSFYFMIWAMGCILELLPRALPEGVARRAASLGGLLFIGLCVILVRVKPEIHLSDLSVAFSCTVLCYFVLHLQSPFRRGWVSEVSQKLSGMSYTLYLCHAPLLVAISAAFVSPWHGWPLSGANLTRFVVVVGSVFVVSYAMYWLFERNTWRLRKLVSERLWRAQPG